VSGNGGCLRNAFASVGCATLLVAGGFVAYQYRGPLRGATRTLVARVLPGAGAAAAHSTGVPSDAGLRAARHAEQQMARRDGPDSVVLRAAELASLVADGLDARARAALDSLVVTLEPGRFTLTAQLRTERLGRELLGPLAGVLAPREPLRMTGGAVVARPGVVAWRPEEFVVRDFPFPSALVPRLVNAITGGEDGTVSILVPETVGEVDIHGDGVTFYRRRSS
jgi:hypothetical protein